VGEEIFLKRIEIVLRREGRGEGDELVLEGEGVWREWEGRGEGGRGKNGREVLGGGWGGKWKREVEEGK
jgi:hypothetical protein